MIRDLSIRRELMQIGRDITEKAASVDVSTEPADQISEAEQALYEVAESGRSSTGFQSFLTALTTAVDVAAAAYRRDGGLAGLATGFADLDRRLGGLHKSDLLILAGTAVDGQDVPGNEHRVQRRPRLPQGIVTRRSREDGDTNPARATTLARARMLRRQALALGGSDRMAGLSSRRC